LDELLDKYADFGVGQFDDLTLVLRVPPFDELTIPEIAALFGGPTQLKAAVDKMQTLLYE